MEFGNKGNFEFDELMFKVENDFKEMKEKEDLDRRLAMVRTTDGGSSCKRAAETYKDPTFPSESDSFSSNNHTVSNRNSRGVQRDAELEKTVKEKTSFTIKNSKNGN